MANLVAYSFTIASLTYLEDYLPQLQILLKDSGRYSLRALVQNWKWSVSEQAVGLV